MIIIALLFSIFIVKFRNKKYWIDEFGNLLITFQLF
jgi:hypothetical protein